MSKLWIADKMYVVDDEVRDEFDRLNDEITTASSAFNDLLDDNERLREENRWKKQVPNKEGGWLRINVVGRAVYHKVFKDSTFDNKLSIYWGWSPCSCCLVEEIAGKLKQFCWYGPITLPEGE